MRSLHGVLASAARVSRPMLLMALASTFASAALAGEPPVNIWVTTAEDPKAGSSSGLIYLADRKSMLQLGPLQNDRFSLTDRVWAAPTAAPAVLNAKGQAWFTVWKDGHPVMPWLNRGFWAAHQYCYLPDEKKALCFWGGSTFKYDPASNGCEDLNIPLDKAPPDVMMGSMAWDPAGRRAILFGGGYVRAHSTQPFGTNTPPPKNAWQPEKWDRRGTWACDPAKNEWRKLETGSKDVAAADARLLALEPELRTLWGAARGLAFEYGDRVLGKKPADLAGLVDKLAADVATLAADFRGKGGDEYEKRQFAAGGELLEKGVLAKLREAAETLRAEDGWKAFGALDAADGKLTEAAEALAIAPPPRHYARLVCDPENKVMVLFGGDGEDRYRADTWLLHLDTDRWERCRPDKHPPVVGSAMVAMDYDSANKVVVLAHQDGSLWTFDTSGRRWRQWRMGGAFGVKGKGATWMSLECAPDFATHVLVAASPDTYGSPCARLTQTIRLDLKTAQEVEAPAGAPEAVWRPAYGQGQNGPANKYALAWSFLPKTQAEYHEKVAAHRKLLDAIPANAWTALKAPYAGTGREYGSFWYDWDRDEIYVYGGGHCGYQGNEWSQYDLKSNLWMESWNPEFPPHPYGSPAGDCWGPTFGQSVQPSNHGYHKCAYWSTLGKLACPFRPYDPTTLYDPDRMRYAPENLVATPGTHVSLAVEMNGSPELLFTVGGGVSRANAKDMTVTRLAGWPPAECSDRFKPVFDTKRNRVMAYGLRNDKDKGGKFNALWAFGLEAGRWEKIEPKVEPDGAAAPEITCWNCCYSTKYDCLMVVEPKGSTWVYDCAQNTFRKVGVGIRNCGVIYSPKLDLFCAFTVEGYGPQVPAVFRYSAGGK